MEDKEQFNLLINIESILDLLNTLGKQKFLSQTELLLLEKNLLSLKLLILSNGINISKFKVSDKHKFETDDKPSKVEKDILDFIKEKEEADSLKIFNAFPQFSRRTIKRNINQLLRRNLISRRVINNNKTIYSPDH